MDLIQTDQVDDIIHKITNKTILSLEETEEVLNTEIIEQAVRSLFNSQRIILFGIGASHLVAKDAHLKFTRIDKITLISEDSHTQLLMANAWGPSGWVALPLMQPGSMLHYAIGILISYVAGYIITRLFIQEKDVINV